MLIPAFAPAVDWRFANRAPADVAEPVTAVPTHPRMGERKANAPPAAASHVPMATVWPEKFMTYASAMTTAMVRMASLRSTTVFHSVVIPLPKEKGYFPPELLFP